MSQPPVGNEVNPICRTRAVIKQLIIFFVDLNDPAILKLLEINTTVHNKHLINCPLQVMALDFLQLDWSKELTERVENAQVILAADVVYHVNITTGFVKTLKKLATTGSIKKDIFIAMEKR